MEDTELYRGLQMGVTERWEVAPKKNADRSQATNYEEGRGSG